MQFSKLSHCAMVLPVARVAAAAQRLRGSWPSLGKSKSNAENHQKAPSLDNTNQSGIACFAAEVPQLSSTKSGVECVAYFSQSEQQKERPMPRPFIAWADSPDSCNLSLVAAVVCSQAPACSNAANTSASCSTPLSCFDDLILPAEVPQPSSTESGIVSVTYFSESEERKERPMPRPDTALSDSPDSCNLSLAAAVVCSQVSTCSRAANTSASSSTPRSCFDDVSLPAEVPQPSSTERGLGGVAYFSQSEKRKGRPMPRLVIELPNSPDSCNLSLAAAVVCSQAPACSSAATTSIISHIEQRCGRKRPRGTRSACRSVAAIGQLTQLSTSAVFRLGA